MPSHPPTRRLSGCYVISLRPVGEHGPVRRAAAAHGARVLALSPWRIDRLGDARARDELRMALAAPRVVFTSPAAVPAAAALQPLRPRSGQRWVAVGEGTARALRRSGVPEVDWPTRMDSEGLLALPALGDVAGLDVGLVTAPGGRGVIATTLADRGARVLRANVYRRAPVAPSPRALAGLRGLAAPAWLLLSSGEALDVVLAAVTGDAGARLRTLPVVAASERLAEQARERGLPVVAVASSARPAAMLDACAEAAAKP